MGDVGNYTSCRNVLSSGYCLNGDDNHPEGGGQPFAGELWLTRVSDGAVLRLAHHRSSACGYFGLSRPTLSPYGRWAAFSSDWASPNCDEKTDTYLIDLLGIISTWGYQPRPDAGLRDGGLGGAEDAQGSDDAALGGDNADVGTSIDTGSTATDTDAGQPATELDAGSVTAADAGNNVATVQTLPEPEAACGCSKTQRSDGMAGVLVPGAIAAGALCCWRRRDRRSR